MNRALASLRAHPVISGVFAVCMVGGALLGAWLLPESLSEIRRVLGGAVAGFGVALLVTATRMMSGAD